MQKVVDAAIIGAGFAGLGAAIKLREAGINSILVLEKGHDVGGCWRENHYPGAACDIPSHLYSFSFEPKADWSRRYAPQQEIFDYLKHCANKYQLYSDIQFDCEVLSAEFDASTGLWQLSTADSELIQARIVITACGQLSQPAYPKLAGLESFSGKHMHSAHWDNNYDFSNKRVAVIGTGASAIQFVPKVAEQAEQLTLFQRSAPYLLPKSDRAYYSWEKKLFRQFPWLQRLSRYWIYLNHEIKMLGFRKLKIFSKPYRWRSLAYLKHSVKSNSTAEKLKPNYSFGCKRVLLSNDYWPCFNRDNVQLVSEAISTVSSEGIHTVDGKTHKADILIYGTGFKATEFLTPLKITGLEGQELNQAWRDGAEAYLGMSIHGFPNLFMLYGPNTNLGHNSIIYMLESQIHYVVQCAQNALKADKRYLHPRADIQQRFNQQIQKALGQTIWNQQCNNWYQNDDGKNITNWPYFTFTYRNKTRKPNWADFHVSE